MKKQLKSLKTVKNKKSCLTMELSQFRKDKWIVYPIRTLNRAKDPSINHITPVHMLIRS